MSLFFEEMSLPFLKKKICSELEAEDNANFISVQLCRRVREKKRSCTVDYEFAFLAVDGSVLISKKKSIARLENLTPTRSLTSLSERKFSEAGDLRTFLATLSLFAAEYGRVKAICHSRSTVSLEVFPLSTGLLLFGH
ncbi:hypothetical protein CEXT_711711 [Caerostris extrusa]|uniref:Uncharacterized protein n=1 Tax=Caerostris extrusa TaxID=172846 RepID=A0AAV4WBK4_CAEEX|nr:hypothetical protein CEXT_711711 [Caerostris extrusa]